MGSAESRSTGPRSNRRKPLLYNEKSRVGRPGLEPGTYGLKVRSSTIELATPGHEEKSEQNLPECGSPTLEEYLLAFSKWSEVELHLYIAQIPGVNMTVNPEGIPAGF